MITKSIERILFQLNISETVDLETLEVAFEDILLMPDIKERDIFLASFLSFLMARQNEAEIRALIKVIIKLNDIKISNLSSKNGRILGLAGSGKKGIKTINISTPSAIIASACGAKIIKSGSRATSSLTGSSDFFSFLGVNNIPFSMEEMLEELSFSFVSIEKRLKKFDKVYGNRFYIPTVLGFVLAALSIPVKCDKIIYGLAHPRQDISYSLIKTFIKTGATILTTQVDKMTYIDELICGEIFITDEKKKYQIIPEKFISNWGSYSIGDFIQRSSSEENIIASIRALKGVAENQLQDLFCLNAGFYLQEAELTNSVDEGYKMARESIKTGASFKHLQNIIKTLKGNLTILEKV